MTVKKRVLFICTHNSARSQMAEGYVNDRFADGYKAYSAGTLPKTVNPFAIAVMKEIGVDISHNRSKSLKEFKGRHFNLVVTVCADASETCPFFPGDHIIHMGFPDPSGFVGDDEEKMDGFRMVRDLIIDWLEKEMPTWTEKIGKEPYVDRSSDE
ncbi:MAG TPA: arsenate reductase ArsC [Methanomassiliicoccales archaeon]|nr:arsenate reductase ArsC [Methanomassiliicoccales archaeon]